MTAIIAITALEISPGVGHDLLNNMRAADMGHADLCRKYCGEEK